MLEQQLFNQKQNSTALNVTLDSNEFGSTKKDWWGNGSNWKFRFFSNEW